MILTTKENFHYKNIGVEGYLTLIEYTSIYPLREEKQKKINRYSKQIEEINQLLMLEELVLLKTK